MTTATPTPPAAPAPAVAPTRRRFTAAEYCAMADAGILTEDDRVELLDGELVQIPPIGDYHASRVNWLNYSLTPALGQRAIVQVQNPVRLNDDTEPHPDIALLRFRDDFYRFGKPTPADVLLLIEVSDTSLAYDRGAKLAAYARAGIPEVWIVNLPDRRVEAYTEPAGSEYAVVRHYTPGARIAPPAFPDIALAVDRIIAT